MAEQPKFTPGPWSVFINDCGDEWSGWPISIGSANDPDKTVVRQGGQYPYAWDTAMSQLEAVANARLIAAAPELYEAALPILKRLDDHENWMVANCSKLGGDEMGFQISVGDARRLRAALAKAEGR